MRCEYAATLADGFGAQRIVIELSTAAGLPTRPGFAFADHVIDEAGKATDKVIAVAKGRIAISRDLGRSWTIVKLKGREHRHVVDAKAIGRSELLIQTSAYASENDKSPQVDLLLASESGEVLAEHPKFSHRWHGCRAVDLAGETLMFAEYPGNRPVGDARPWSPRVFRSRDRGRNWEVAFVRSGAQIRHFHFLQARPGAPGEWWLTSGDLPHECHVWVSKDDGGSWRDATEELPERFKVDGVVYRHDAFRLTDLAWVEGDVIWATDDTLGASRPPGARVFRSKAQAPLVPRFVGLGRWHFRSLVDLGDYLLAISQRSNRPQSSEQDRRPGVYLLAKTAPSDAPGFQHLFDLRTFPAGARPAGFTYSKASRAAKEGVFFTYRSDEDVFDGGHKLLRWRVRWE
ncbi:MAG TPA: hypothetical protein VHC42_09515 [Rhizomicrobium sp.]|nr:hypothetical protein [Rhizomicrobium sp.]